MLKDAPVIILDEATANVDPENEDWLQQAIEALTHEKTVLMIAHRLKTVRRADQILVLDGGQIVQRAAMKTYRAARPLRRFCRRQEGDHGLEALNTFPPKPPRDKRFRSPRSRNFAAVFCLFARDGLRRRAGSDIINEKWRDAKWQNASRT